MQNNTTYALVTGASMGLGRCFALELAQRRINVILVSLPGENLKEVAEESKQLGVDAQIYETDITQRDNIVEMCDWLNSRFDIFMLINNAGSGGTRSFLDTELEYIENIIRLNVMATSVITHQLLPNLIKQEQAYILNVSSMAAFSPIGFKTVYPASKSFIRSFTYGLAQEFHGSNVFISVVHPGPMKTNNDVTSRIDSQGVLGKIGLVSPEKVAEKSISRLLRGDAMILPGFFNKINWALMKIVPNNIRIPLITKAMQREITA